ncbi:MAG: NUDIX hydrolase [Chloroflexi bacterium]|nr:NUDIX hydrolase [Chloroflexota bacterium]
MNTGLAKTTIVTVLCYDPERRAILLVEQAHPDGRRAWALPGGTWEPNESAEEAAIREMLEETGLPVRLLGLYDSRVEVVMTEQGKVGVYILTYEAQCPAHPPQPQDPDAQVIRAAWVPVEALFHLPFAHPGQLNIILRYLKEKGYETFAHRNP